MNIFKKVHDKKFMLYAVYMRDNPNKFLTLTLTKDEAFEYAYKALKLDHEQHYKLWCACRQLDPESTTSWVTYLTNCITEQEKSKYLISKVSYRYKDVVAMLRMFGDCPPIGSSFDTPIEFQYMETKIKFVDANESLHNEMKNKTND